MGSQRWGGRLGQDEGSEKDEFQEQGEIQNREKLGLGLVQFREVQWDWDQVWGEV